MLDVDENESSSDGVIGREDVEDVFHDLPWLLPPPSPFAAPVLWLWCLAPGETNGGLASDEADEDDVDGARPPRMGLAVMDDRDTFCLGRASGVNCDWSMAMALPNWDFVGCGANFLSSLSTVLVGEATSPP